MPLHLRLLWTIYKNIKYHRFGRCNICGNYTLFLCLDKNNPRETMHCPFCKTCSRKRHVVSIILKCSDAPIIKSLKKFAKKTFLDIYNTDKDIFNKYFCKNNHYFSSIYAEEYPVGTEIEKNVFCQNIEALTFIDESFDIIITEDVLEHVRNYKMAFSEIYRVLKKGGMHIFTIPFLFNQETIVRVDTSTTEDIYILPPEYHGDSRRGKIIAYRTFGVDLFNILSDTGFSTAVYNSSLYDSQCGIYNSTVFISKKI